MDGLKTISRIILLQFKKKFTGWASWRPKWLPEEKDGQEKEKVKPGMDGGQRQGWQADTWQVGGFSKEAQNVRICTEKKKEQKNNFCVSE